MKNINTKRNKIKLNRIEAVSIMGCYFEYFGTITILGTNEIKHHIKLSNPKDDVYCYKTISQNEWDGLRKFAYNYLGI